jgi:hypothetical protein
MENNIKAIRNQIRIHIFNKQYNKAIDIIKPLLIKIDNEELHRYYKICYINTINYNHNSELINYFF